MKRTAIIAVAVLAIVGTGYGFAKAHSGGNGWGHMGSSYGHMGGNYGGHMMDYAAPNTNGGYCWEDNTRAKADLTEKDAEEIIAYRVTRNNPNLKIGKVKGTEDGFEVQVVTRKGEALVDKLLVEKDTGRVYRVYE